MLPPFLIISFSNESPLFHIQAWVIRLSCDDNYMEQDTIPMYNVDLAPLDVVISFCNESCKRGINLL